MSSYAWPSSRVREIGPEMDWTGLKQGDLMRIYASSTTESSLSLHVNELNTLPEDLVSIENINFMHILRKLCPISYNGFLYKNNKFKKIVISKLYLQIKTIIVIKNMFEI